MAKPVKRTKTSIVIDPGLLNRLKYEALREKTDVSTLLAKYAEQSLPRTIRVRVVQSDATPRIGRVRADDDDLEAALINQERDKKAAKRKAVKS